MPLTDAQRQRFMIIVKGTHAALGGTAQRTVNMFAYRRDLFPAAWVPGNTLIAFLATVKADWKAAVSAQWTWDTAEIRCLDDSVEPTSQTAVAEAGTVGGDSLPSYAAMVLSKQTALRGRSYQGRSYIAGIPESGTTGNALTNGHKALLDALAVDLKSSFTDANGNRFKPAVLSQKHSVLTTSPATATTNDITNIVARQILGRMASRRSPVTA